MVRAELFVTDRRDVLLVEGDVAVVLLVHVQVFHQTVVQEVLEGPQAPRQLLHVRSRHARPTPLHDNVRPAAVETGVTLSVSGSAPV